MEETKEPITQNTAKEVDYEKKLLACFHDEIINMPGPMDKRTAFLVQNRCWIDFLNEREETKKPDKSNAVHYIWKKLGSNEIDHETHLDLSKMTKQLMDWQAGNFIFSNKEPGHICETSTFKYGCEKDLIIAVSDWMFENLKAISRGLASQLFDIPSFGLKEASALLKKVTVQISPAGTCFEYKENDQSFIPSLVRYVHKFTMYIASVLEIKKTNTLQWARAGIFKVNICPYQKRNAPECGLVFISHDPAGEACPKHTNLYRVLKCKRKQRGFGLKKNINS